MVRSKKQFRAAKAAGNSGSSFPRIQRIAGLFLLSLIQASFILPFAGYVSAEADSKEPFEHDVRLNFTPGLPGEVTLGYPNSDLKKTRVMLTVDGKLLVAAMQPMGPGKFHAIFPSPSENLRYRFQFISTKGKAILSKEYSVRANCVPTEQSALVTQAIDLDQDIIRLNYLNKALSGLEEKDGE